MHRIRCFLFASSTNAFKKAAVRFGGAWASYKATSVTHGDGAVCRLVMCACFRRVLVNGSDFPEVRMLCHPGRLAPCLSVCG